MGREIEVAHPLHPDELPADAGSIKDTLSAKRQNATECNLFCGVGVDKNDDRFIKPIRF
jgi:hypothetical protein